MHSAEHQGGGRRGGRCPVGRALAGGQGCQGSKEEKKVDASSIGHRG